MALVNFEIAFKADCQTLTDYVRVKERIDNIDLTAIGQNVTKQEAPDNDPDNYVIAITLTGENTPPS